MTDDWLEWLEVLVSVVGELAGRLLEIIVTNASIIHLRPGQHPPSPGQSFQIQFWKFKGISDETFLQSPHWHSLEASLMKCPWGSR